MRRCRICENDLETDKTSHPEDQRVTWEMCLNCQRQIKAVQEQAKLEKTDVYQRRHWLEATQAERRWLLRGTPETT